MNDEESSIEKLKRALYSRDENIVPKERRGVLHDENSEVAQNWGDPESLSLSPEEFSERIMSVHKKKSIFDKFLVISIAFFLIAAAITAFVFFGGMNVISSSNVDIKITAPISVASGEEVSLDVSVLNQNRTDLEDAYLTVDYPSGAKSAENGALLSRQRISLGTILQNTSANQTVNFVIFGQKETMKTVNFGLEYSVKGSSATFSKEKSFDFKISSSPIIIDLSYPKEINSGQVVSFAVTVTSNSATPLNNVLVKAEYPYGFTFQSSNISAINSENDLWNIGDLQNGGKKTLNFSGVLVGQDEEDRTFRISAGTSEASSTDKLSVYLVSTDALVGVRRSFYGLSVEGGDNGIILPGQSAPVTISWKNTLTDKLVNNTVSAVISGNVFDKTKVSPNSGGYYRSSDSTVIWDQNGNGLLGSISPGQDGQVGLSFFSFPLSILQNIKNPHVDIHVVMSGTKSGIQAMPVSSSKDIVLKVPTTIGLIAESRRTSGPFTNTGPIPPKADLETTYTVSWTITNTVNDLTQTSVSAKLPYGVVWKGLVSPGSEKVSYDPDKRIVVWNVGNVTYGAGFSSSPRSVSFQLGLTPSANQTGSSLPLTSDASAQAVDSYTGMAVSASDPAVTTRYLDSTFRDGDDKVVQ